jgi:soluble lytic murein transglycosylase-like protein
MGLTEDTLGQTLAACVLATSAVFTLSGARAITAEALAIEEIAIELPPAPDPRRSALVGYLSDRYRVEREGIRVVVDEAHVAAAEFDLDPLLVLAVIGVESSFNPAARSGFGARGLMQVVPRFHREKLAEHGGEAALADPRVNVLVGTRILEEYLRRSGSLRAGLQRYAGSRDDAERRYARRVIGEKARLQRVVQQALQDAEHGRRSL